MTWFTETPWPPIVILGIVALILLAAWSSQKRAVWLGGVVVAIALAVAVFFVEKSIITEKELIEQKIVDLTTAFQRKDREKTLSYFSVQAAEPRDLVAVALELVTVHDDLDVKDFDVRLFGESTGAVSRFRANGTVTAYGITGSHPSQWEVTWQKEAGDWKIIKVQRLNPITEERMQTFEKRPH